MDSSRLSSNHSFSHYVRFHDPWYLSDYTAVE